MGGQHAQSLYVQVCKLILACAKLVITFPRSAFCREIVHGMWSIGKWQQAQTHAFQVYVVLHIYQRFLWQSAESNAQWGCYALCP